MDDYTWHLKKFAEFNLSWKWLWRLFMLRLRNPSRAAGFTLKVIDYNINWKEHRNG